MKKKILSLALAVLMLLPSLALCISAQAIHPKDDTTQSDAYGTTIYASSVSGKSTNDGLSESSPVNDLTTAANKLPAEGGRILILDELKLPGNKNTKVNGGSSIATGTVYIEGKKQADGSYAKLIFSAAGKNLALFGTTVFHNLEINASVSGTHTISANGYNVTIGANVKTTEKVEGAVMNISGGIGVTSSASTNLVEGGALTIYGGTWDNVSAASWAFGEATSNWVSTPGVVNVYGGTITNLFSKRAYERLVNITSATINYYGGNVTTITGRVYEGDVCEHTLNLYAPTTANLAGVFEDGTGTINDYSAFSAPESFGTTVYVASAAKGAGDGSSADNAMKGHLQDAAALLPAEGGRIVVLDNISANFSTYNMLKVNGGSAIATGTVYIQGVKQDDGTYSKVSFGKSGDQYIRVFGTTVFFDIELEKATNGTLWVSANAYDLTIGRNVSTSRAVDDAYVSISGGVAGSSHGADLSDTTKSTKIYSGTWDAVHAASYNPGGDKPSTAGEVTLYGGTFTTVYSKRNHANLINIESATINYYGGNVTTFTGERRGDDATTHTLNCYTTVIGSQLSGVFVENGDGVVNDFYSNHTSVEYPEFVTPTDFSGITTIYVSYANGNDSNDGLTPETAMKEINNAAKKLPATGGRLLIVDEAKLYIDKAIKVTSSSTVATDTVYIEGMKQDDGSYARLAFGAAGKNIVLTGKTVIYNLEIYGTVAGTHTISADGYDVTIGTNVSLYKGNVSGSKINLIGGIGVTASASSNLNSEGGTLTIYSGEWENVSAVSWAFGSAESNWKSTPGAVTVYGGTINNLYTKRSYARLINITSATVNYYAGDVTTIIGEEYEGDVCTHTLNLYAPTEATLSGVLADGGTGTVNRIYLNQFIAPTIPDSMTTIYIAATARGDGDGSSAENAKSGLTLETAANLLPAEGGRIVIVEDMTIKFSAANSLKVTSSKVNPTGPIYIEGLLQDDGTYPQLSFNKDGDQYLRIFGTTVIYNLELNKSVQTEGTTGELWISANGYDLTIGDTVTTSVADGCTINLTSGVGSSTHGADLSASPVATNIYGGTWNTVSAASWNPGNGGADRNSYSGEINIYGGTITTLYTKRSHDNLKTITSAIINYYAGDVKTITGEYKTGDVAVHTLNLYAPTSAALTGVFAEANTNTLVGNEYLLEGTIPEFEVPSFLKLAGVQETELDSTSNTYSVRFVGVITGEYESYDRVGFYVKANGLDYGKTNRYNVYSTMAGPSVGIPYTAAQLGGKYIFELPMHGIPASAGMVTFEVQAFAVIEGVEYLDTAYNVVYNAGEFVTLSEAKTSLVSLNLRKPQNSSEKTDATVGFDARAERIKDFIATNLPDSFGVQECNSDWYDYLNENLAELGYVSANESVIADLSVADKLIAYDTSGWVLNNYVYYNKNTTDLVASGAVWLGEDTASETAVLSGRYFIGASWAILSDRATGKQFVHISTHLNAASEDMSGNKHDYRAEELACLMNFVNGKAEFAGLDIFITGDFNENMTGTDGTVYSTMTDTYKYTDARKTAPDTDQMNTYNSSCGQFDADNTGTNTVTDRVIAAYTCKDYCFHSGNATVNSFDVVNKWNGSYLSDHNALVVEFTLS